MINKRCKSWLNISVYVHEYRLPSGSIDRFWWMTVRNTINVVLLPVSRVIVFFRFYYKNTAIFSITKTRGTGIWINKKLQVPFTCYICMKYYLKQDTGEIFWSKIYDIDFLCWYFLSWYRIYIYKQCPL